MKAEDLKTKTPDELKKLLLENRKAQFEARFQGANGQPQKASEIRKTRRAIARIKTFLNGGAKAAAASKKTPARAAVVKAKPSKKTA